MNNSDMNDSAVNNMGYTLEAKDISKSFKQGSQQLHVLESVNLQVKAGESVAIVGASGAGKSTLLHILGGLDNPDSGDVILGGQSLWSLKQKQRGYLRNQFLGFVYQFHHLLPEFTALENVSMPLLIRGEDVSRARERASYLLDRVGLKKRMDHKPGELSGGERQRAAVARALSGSPKCILGDEPTGNLDEKIADHVYGLLVELNQELQTSMILVTHDPRLAARMDRRLELRNHGLHEMN